MQAVESGVGAMAAPNTSAPLQARTDLAACVSALYSTLREQLAADDVRRVLFWLARFSRCALGLGVQGFRAQTGSGKG